MMRPVGIGMMAGHSLRLLRKVPSRYKRRKKIVASIIHRRKKK